jgi:hypothetical protein
MNKPNFYITQDVNAALAQRGDWKVNEVPLASGELILEDETKREDEWVKAVFAIIEKAKAAKRS